MSDVIFCKDSVNIMNTKMKMIGQLTLMGTIAFLFVKKQKTKVDSRKMDNKNALANRFYLKKFQTNPKRTIKSRYG